MRAVGGGGEGRCGEERRAGSQAAKGEDAPCVGWVPAWAQEAESAPPSAWPQWASSPGGHQIRVLRPPGGAGLEVDGVLRRRAGEAAGDAGLALSPSRAPSDP